MPKSLSRILDRLSHSSIGKSKSHRDTSDCNTESAQSDPDIGSMTLKDLESAGQNNPNMKAVKALYQDLTKVWDKARKKSRWTLYGDLGTADPLKIDEKIIIEAWTQSYIGCATEYASTMQERYSDPNYWSGIDDDTKECIKLQDSRIVELFDTGQVPTTSEKDVFQFDPKKGKFRPPKDVALKDIGSKMIEYQHEWWQDRVKAGNSKRSDIPTRLNAYYNKRQGELASRALEELRGIQ